MICLKCSFWKSRTGCLCTARVSWHMQHARLFFFFCQLDTGTINCSLVSEEALLQWLIISKQHLWQEEVYLASLSLPPLWWPGKQWLLFLHEDKWQVWCFCHIYKPDYMPSIQLNHLYDYRWMGEEYGLAIETNISLENPIFDLASVLTPLLLLLSHFTHVWLCATPSLGFSRQEHWSGLPFPSPSDSTTYELLYVT